MSNHFTFTLQTIRNQAFKYTFVLGLILAAASCVSSKSTLDLQNRIDVLERRIIALERHKFKALADIKEELSLLKRKTAQDIKTLSEARRSYKKKLAGLKKDLELMAKGDKSILREIETNADKTARLNKRLGDQEIALNELQVFFQNSVNNYSSLSPYEEHIAFEKAFKLYKAGRFKRAKSEFRNFRDKYPNSDLTDDCLFFTAYINFLREKYSEASLRFFEMLEQFPQSNKAEEARWWLAATLERSGDLNGALDLYKQLVKSDKKNPFANKARARLNELESIKLQKP